MGNSTVYFYHRFLFPRSLAAAHMTFDSLAKQSEDSISAFREVYNFLRKKALLDAEYAKNICTPPLLRPAC